MTAADSDRDDLLRAATNTDDFVDPADVTPDTRCTCRFDTVYSRQRGVQWVLRRDRHCPFHGDDPVLAAAR